MQKHTLNALSNLAQIIKNHGQRFVADGDKVIDLVDGRQLDDDHYLVELAMQEAYGLDRDPVTAALAVAESHNISWCKEWENPLITSAECFSPEEEADYEAAIIESDRQWAFYALNKTLREKTRNTTFRSAMLMADKLGIFNVEDKDLIFYLEALCGVVEVLRDIPATQIALLTGNGPAVAYSLAREYGRDDWEIAQLEMSMQRVAGVLTAIKRVDSALHDNLIALLAYIK